MLRGDEFALTRFLINSLLLVALFWAVDVVF